MQVKNLPRSSSCSLSVLGSEQAPKGYCFAEAFWFSWEKKGQVYMLGSLQEYSCPAPSLHILGEGGEVALVTFQ